MFETSDLIDLLLGSFCFLLRCLKMKGANNTVNNSPSFEKLLPSNESQLSTETSTVDAATAIIVAILVFISLLSVFGNALVLTAIYMNYNLRTVGNFLFGNLALSDFLQGAIAIPCRIVELLYADCNYRRVFCPVSIALSIFFGGSSNLTILFISVERFIGVRWPFLYYSFITTRFVFTALIATWVSLAIFASLPLFAWGGLTNYQADFCRLPLFLTTNYITALYLLVHIVPMCIIVPLYIFILKASLKSIRKIHIQELSVRTRAAPGNQVEVEEIDGTAPQVRRSNITDQAARQRKSAKTVSLVVGLFIVLIMPVVVIDIVEMLGGPTVSLLVIRIATGMTSANHFVNVFIYAGCSGDYKRAFAKILSRFRSYFTRKSQ